MRVAIISDIHGNCVALQAVLADLQHQPFDQLVCLGDALQGGPQPAETLARLRDLACPVVMGNADAWLLTGQTSATHETTTEQQRAIRDWSLAQLSDPDREFTAHFRPTLEIPLAGSRRLLCFHGSPRSFDDVILPLTPEDEFQRLLAPYAGYILAGGHTHLQQIRRRGDSFFFNPGSVGFAYRHPQPPGQFRADPWAEYAMLTVDVERLALEFRHVPFDVNALIEAYHASGRPFAAEAVAQYVAVATPDNSLPGGTARRFMRTNDSLWGLR